MSRKTLLTLVAFTALVVGCFSLLAPDTLLAVVKRATPNPAAIVQARTVGVLLIAVGILNLLVRGHEDSPTLEAVLWANLVLQLAILPIDPGAYASGAYSTWGSFLPNTILHVVLAAGFVVCLAQLRRRRSVPT